MDNLDTNEYEIFKLGSENIAYMFDDIAYYVEMTKIINYKAIIENQLSTQVQKKSS